MQECTTEFWKRQWRHSWLSSTFHMHFYFIGERQRKSTKNLRKICHWKLIFVIWSYNTWARNCTRHGGTWAGKHTIHVAMWSYKHARHDSTWTRKHARRIGSWICKHASTLAKGAREDVRLVGTWARKDSGHVGTLARKARSLADSKIKEGIELYLRIGKTWIIITWSSCEIISPKSLFSQFD